MIDTHEYKGLWWIPKAESNKLAGTLRIVRGAVSLDLLGDFGNEPLASVPGQRAFSLDLAEHPRIVGTSSEGKAITLEGHLAAPYQVSFPGISTPTYRRNVAMIGKEFAQGEIAKFDEIAVRTSDLNEWAQSSGFHFSLEGRQNSEQGFYESTGVEVKFEVPDDVPIGLAHGESAFVRFRGSSSGIGARSNAVTISQDCALHLRFARPAALDEIFGRVKEIRNFLSLAVGRPVAVLAATAFQDTFVAERTGLPRPIELYWEVAYNPEPPERRLDPHKLLFGLAGAKPDISTVLRKWFSKQSRLEPVFNLFFGVRHLNDMPLEVRFLVYAQAVETYDYRRRRKPKRLTLAERMNDVLDRCRTVSARVVGSGPNDRDDFVDAFKNARNYYTHYTPNLESKAARGASLLLLFLQLRAIIEMSLLRELGFGCRDIDAILSRIGRYGEVQRLKRIVAGEPPP